MSADTSGCRSRLTTTNHQPHTTMTKPLRRMRLTGEVTGLTGDVSGLWGYVSSLTGDVSGLTGNVTGLRGDLSEIPSSARPCDIADWIES